MKMLMTVSVMMLVMTVSVMMLVLSIVIMLLMLGSGGRLIGGRMVAIGSVRIAGFQIDNRRVAMHVDPPYENRGDEHYNQEC